MDPTYNSPSDLSPSPWPTSIPPETVCGFQVYSRKITYSTNEDAKDLKIGDAVWAETQLQGRARSGRSWESPAGNLYLSVKLAGKETLAASAMLSLVAGLAICDVVRMLLQDTDAAVRIKWPNDILVNDHKLAGILLETNYRTGQIAVIVGMGLNIQMHPQNQDRLTTSLYAQLQDSKRDTSSLNIKKVLHACLTQLRKWDDIWRNVDGPEQISKAFCSRAWGHEQMTVKLGDEIVSGQFLGLGQHGSLRLLSKEGVITLNSGEVIFGSNSVTYDQNTTSKSGTSHAAAH